MGGKSSTWIGGAVVVALLIVVGGWFVAISPTLDATATASADADAATARNEQLRLQLATLKKQFENLDSYKAELNVARVEIPTTGDLSGFARQIDALGVASGLTVVSVAPGTPIDVAPVVPLAPVEVAPAEGESTEGETAEGEATPDAAEGDAAVPPVAVGPAPIEGFVAVPVDVTVLGGVANATTFIAGLQAEGQRLFLVTGFRATGQREADASGGRPATKLGDVEITITGYIYVLKQPAPPVDPAEPTTPPALPVPAEAVDPLGA
ncbi:hypothetical protein [Cellulomonas humilata]|uniref:Tfp pilus assembly protein PilO n=1 Tax=Cellulomonas humilata TaxID=144055 RepID=A0ABU0EF52_9CELL|nr:hypothetical protein [Cellulomonas humilata]MDQ0373905.1 hypothetical protein [Cellulomonas humilata]